MVNIGKIEIITGPMFSGKTEELIKRVIRAEIAKKQYIVFKPKIDTRTEDQIASRNGYTLPAIPLNELDLNAFGYVYPMAYLSNQDIICFDEAQFFPQGVVNLIQKLSDVGKRVIISGLDMNYLREPFGPMPKLMSIADEVTKLTAICHNCGQEAIYTQLLNQDNVTETIIIGDLETYEARCRNCYGKSNG